MVLRSSQESLKMTQIDRVCRFCSASSAFIRIDDNHVIKRSQGGYFGPTIPTCANCHDKFDNDVWRGIIDGDMISVVDLTNGEELCRIPLREIMPVPSATPDIAILAEIEQAPIEYLVFLWEKALEFKQQAFAYECAVAYLLKQRIPSDPRWFGVKDQDWADLASTYLRKELGNIVAASTLREDARVWEKFVSLGEKPWEVMLERFPQLPPTMIRRSIYSENPIDALEQAADKGWSVRQFEEHIEYKSIEVRWGWIRMYLGTGEFKDIWFPVMVSKWGRYDPPTIGELAKFTKIVERHNASARRKEIG